MKSSPTISITIPCLNEEKYIGICLESIILSTFSKDRLRVYVCDGLSTDNTRNIVKEISAKHSFIELLDNEKRTTPFALNLGIKANDADIKIILGAHSEVYPDYIDKCIEVFNAHPDVWCAGGIIENVIEDETTRVIATAMGSSFGVGNAHFRTGEKDGYVDTVAFGAYKKEVFESIGYFDEELSRNQDDEFNFRLLKAGGKIFLSKDIRSKYYVRASLQKLKKQYFQYGYWKVYVNKKHRAVTTIRQLVPALFVAFLFGGLILSFFHKVFFILYLAGIFMYIIAGLYSASKKAKGLKEQVRILQVFFYLHWFYGTGYLEGIFYFLILGKKPAASRTTLSR